MDKRTALRTLVEHSYFVSDATKSELLPRIDEMSDSDVNALGRFLAWEKKHSLERNKNMVSSANALIEELNVQDKKPGT